MRVLLALTTCVAIGLAPLAGAGTEDAAPAGAHRGHDPAHPAPIVPDAPARPAGPPTPGVSTVIEGAPTRIVLSAGGPACIEFVPPSSWAIDIPDCLRFHVPLDVQERVYGSRIPAILIG